jgi:hypothetical protein
MGYPAEKPPAQGIDLIEETLEGYSTWLPNAHNLHAITGSEPGGTRTGPPSTGSPPGVTGTPPAKRAQRGA